MSAPATAVGLGDFLEGLGLAVFVDRRGAVTARAAAATMARRAAHFLLAEGARRAPDSTRYAVLRGQARAGEDADRPDRGSRDAIHEAARRAGIPEHDGALRFRDLVARFDGEGGLGTGAAGLRVEALAERGVAEGLFHAPRAPVDLPGGAPASSRRIWITGGEEGLEAMRTCLQDLDAIARPGVARWEFAPGTRSAWISSTTRLDASGRPAPPQDGDVAVVARHLADAFLPMWERKGRANHGRPERLSLLVDPGPSSAALGALARLRRSRDAERLEARLVETRAERGAMEAFGNLVAARRA